MTLEFARRIHDLSVKELPTVKFDGSQEYDRLVVMLYTTSIEQLGSVLTLFTNDVSAGANTLFRSYLEAFVDLQNLLTDPSYVDVCNYSYSQQWMTVFREADEDNPFLAGLTDNENYREIVSQHKKQIADLESKGITHMTVLDRFKKAEMKDVYRSVYNFACAESHNNIRSLASRHLEADKDGKLEVVAYRGFSEEEHEALLDSVCGTLVNISIQVHEKFQSGRTHPFNAFKEELTEYRAKRDGE